ncbi:MAG: FHA domain-containing protein [Sinobacterium sp.]|nr:FHA domain-containing protein [Sinobacterium sp.]
MYKIQEQGKPETAIWLNKLETILSTDGNPDIVLKKTYMQEMVCSAKISSAENDKLFITDQTFNHDIAINDNIIAKGSRAELHPGDTLVVGKSAFEISNPSIALKRLTSQDTANISWKLIGVSNWLDGQEFEVKGKAILGRDKSCDITIPGSHLSRHHAEIFVTGDTLLIKDLGSSNGSFVNGQAFTETKVHHGDEVRFDQLTFRVEAPKAYTDALIHNVSQPTAEGSSSTKTVDAHDKQWVTKPTSVGNQITDADIRLRNHQKHQRITYIIFGIAISTAIISTVIWQMYT